MNKKKLKEKALAHYDRMISWVEKQNPGEFSNSIIMEYEGIGESWFGDNCSYCRRFGLTCVGCPLFNNSIPGYCCGGWWHIMNSSVIWAEWLVNAREVREYIRENG